VVSDRVPPRHQLGAGLYQRRRLRGTFAYGVGDRAEVFGSFLVDTRIDRDIRPIFVNDPAFGGFIDRYRRSISTGRRQRRRFVRGAKFNILSESRGNPAALALRGMIKLPTGKSTRASAPAKPIFRLMAS